MHIHNKLVVTRLWGKKDKEKEKRVSHAEKLADLKSI